MMHRIHIIITMGFFSSLFGCNKPTDESSAKNNQGAPTEFVSDTEYKENRNKQITMAPQTMEQLRGYGVTDESKLKLEYFFYTNAEGKAESLAAELTDLGYEGDHGLAEGGSDLFVITGWTTPMTMDNATVVDWTGKMCDVGRKFDCEFDGWGTNPEQ